MIQQAAVGPDRDAAPVAPLCHELQVDAVVLVPKKHGLAGIGALCDVVRTVWYLDAGDACHGRVIG